MRTVHAGTIRNYGPHDDSGGFNVARRADPECFGKRANMVNERFRPECASCTDHEALGGEMIETQGDFSATFRFLCGDCGPPRLGWSLIVRNIAGWDAVQKIAPGVYRMMKSSSGVPSCNFS